MKTKSKFLNVSFNNNYNLEKEVIAIVKKFAPQTPEAAILKAWNQNDLKLSISIISSERKPKEEKVDKSTVSNEEKETIKQNIYKWIEEESLQLPCNLTKVGKVLNKHQYEFKKYANKLSEFLEFVGCELITDTTKTPPVSYIK